MIYAQQNVDWNNVQIVVSIFAGKAYGILPKKF